MNNATRKLSRLSVLCIALFVAWCASLAISAYLARSASASAAVCQKSQELAGILAPDLAAVRAHVTGLLEPAAAPRQLLVLDALPLRGPGKPDRDAIAALAHRGPDVPGPDGA